ncbi:MAG: fibronectin type III domain-containing protein [Candidatus Pacebacteria bacterium]|nr:fibronectin type III domain-containing protein [Candidatus Paceibacterota bacterium]
MWSLKNSVNLKKIFFFSFLIFFISAKVVVADGIFSGYAWGENIGWINFAPTGGGVSVNSSGDLYGYAWGENIGWLSFNCIDASSCASVDYKVSISPFYASQTSSGGGGCPACPSCENDVISPEISKIEVSKITSKLATISWETNEKTDSLVQYGINEKYTFISGNPIDISTPLLEHEVLLPNLSSSTDYDFKIISRDVAGNISLSDNISFKTTELTETEIDDSDPIILSEETSVRDITSKSAMIFWQTNKKTNSFVRFRKANNDQSPWEEVGTSSEYTVEHLVKLDRLESFTTYEYQAKSMDLFGNSALSKVSTFTTKKKAVISEVAVSDITLASAVVSWKTNIPITSEVDYGFSIEYGNKYESKIEDRVTMHRVQLKDLESGKIYHYRVKGRDEGDNLVISDDYVFNTYAVPIISNYDITEVKDYSASIKWSSNIETDSTVIFTNTKTLESRTQGDAKFVLDHKIDLTNLSPGTEYTIKIEGRDIFGNMAKSSDIKIVTLIDNIPPKIDNIRTDVSISSSKKGKTQLIVVWRTDEPATSQIVLYENGNEENRNNSSTYDSNLTTKHTSVFTNLNAGTVYRFKVESADKAGNLAESGEFVVLTPKNRKSILQIILDIIEKTFGWTRNI